MATTNLVNAVEVRTTPGGFSLRELLNVLFRRKWVILAIAIPVIIIGGLSLFGEAGSFTATSRVVVELVKVDLPQWDNSGRNIDYDRELGTMIAIAMSLPVSEAAALAISDSIDVIRASHETLQHVDSVENLQGFLLENMDVAVVGESSILEFRFTSASPRVSLMAVDALRSAFVDYQVTGRKNVASVSYYVEQMAVVRAELDSLLGVRTEILQESGYSSLVDEFRFDSGLLADVESQLSRTIVERRSLEFEFGRLSRYLEGDPRDFPMGPDENRSTSLLYWMNIVAKHDDELNGILTLYTDESAPARQHRHLIESSLKMLHQEENKYVRGIGLGLSSLREKEAALRDEVLVLQNKNSKAPRVYHRVSLIDSEVKSLNELLTAIQGKWGEVRMNQFADERVSSVVPLSGAELVSVLTGSKTIVYFVMILVFAIALGIVAGFVAENLDHRVYGPADIENNLKLPVLASVARVD